MRISLQDKISYILDREPIRFSKLPDKYVLELERSGKTFASKTISWYLYTQAYNFIKSKEV